jgi:hypothetical protein
MARTSAWRTRGRLALLYLGLLWGSATARADVPVDTGNQARGSAPRLELELGPAFAMGLGHACRHNPDAEVTVASMDGVTAPTTTTAAAPDTCTSVFGMAGAQAVALVRPFNHWALGARFAYDAVLGSHQVYVDGKGGKASYGRKALHLAAQLRWYSRRVMPGGLYLALHGGVLWWTDTLDKVAADGVTRSAPELGFELGGLFAPYRGPGVTLAVQGWLALFPGDPAAASRSSGSTFDYSPFVFFGVVARLALGVSL